MKKAIMISAEQYDKILKCFGNAMEELKAVRVQFSAFQAQENILNSLESGEESQEYAELEKIFEIYSNNQIITHQEWAVIILRRSGKPWIGLTSNQTVTQGS